MEHITRSFPKKADALLAGGSLYWIFSSFILARQKIIALEPVVVDEQKKCKIILAREIVRTENYPHRPFQGWRYLNDPPPDLGKGDGATQEGLLPLASPEIMRALGLKD